jgi:hypothetical protein
MDPLAVSMVYSAAGRHVLDSVRKTSLKVADEAPAVKMTESGELLSGPGHRLSSGIYFPDGEPTPAIFVEQEDSWAESKAQAIAEQIPGQVNVVVRGTAQSIWPTEAVSAPDDSPVRPGDSVSNYRGRAGTVGCLVTYEKGGTSLPGFVGSAHVLGMLNAADAGREQNADPIIRPGVPDGPKSYASRIGYLKDYSYLSHYQKRASRVTTPNREDVGLALFYDDTSYDDVNLVPNPQNSQGRKRITGVVQTEEIQTYCGTRVYKIGRTSGLTQGTFSGIETDQFSIKLPDGQVYIYFNVFLIEAPPGKIFSKSGDSGALVYTQDLKGLGLIIGGNDRFSWASPLAACLETVSARLLL